MEEKPPKSKESVLLVAYQVTAQMMTNESQLVWQRTGVFLLFHTIVIGGLVALWQAFTVNPKVLIIPLFASLIAIIAGYYVLGWYASMRRNWDYHDFYVRLMNEQEKELGISNFGPANRGEPLAAGHEARVAGKQVKFFWLGQHLKARTMETLMTAILGLVYLVAFFVALGRLMS